MNIEEKLMDLALELARHGFENDIRSISISERLFTKLTHEISDKVTPYNKHILMPEGRPTGSISLFTPGGVIMISNDRPTTI